MTCCRLTLEHFPIRMSVGRDFLDRPACRMGLFLQVHWKIALRLILCEGCWGCLVDTRIVDVVFYSLMLVIKEMFLHLTFRWFSLSLLKATCILARYSKQIRKIFLTKGWSLFHFDFSFFSSIVMTSGAWLRMCSTCDSICFLLIDGSKIGT